MKTCPFCNSSSSPIRAFQTRGEEKLHLTRCDSCLCEFLDPQPSDAWLREEYSGYFEMRDAKTPTAKGRLCRFIMDKLGPLEPGTKLLEIGGGEGHLIRELLRAYPKTQITLVEPQANADAFPPSGVSVHAILIEQWIAEAPPEQFDVLVAMDLLEHLRDPADVMRRLVASRLKPGGKVIVTTPNATSVLRKILGKSWPHYKVEHLTYPSDGALRTLARKVGLQIIELESLSKPLPIGYLTTVLRNFGPSSARLLGRCLDALLPKAVRNWHLAFPSGELLFVGLKNGYEGAGKSSSDSQTLLYKSCQTHL